MKSTFLIVVYLTVLNLEVKGQKTEQSLNEVLNQVFSDDFNGELSIDKSTDTNEGSYESCGENDICIPFYNCKNTTGTINSDGENLLDIRVDIPRICTSYLETCCSLNKETIDPVIPTPKLLDDINNSCGKRNNNGLLFKISGSMENEAEYGEFPWMIAVLKQEQIEDEILNIYQCGGSIIHPEVVLTAAHCVHKHKPIDLVVRAGEWDTQKKDEIFKEQDRQVIEILMHEKFSRAGLHNDIALLFTSEPFILGEDVSAICLPPPNMNFDDSRCFATGWGKDQFGQKGKYHVIMKKIDLPVVPHNTCQARLRETRLGKIFNLDESFMCAGGELGKDTCKGDGGSPLSCPIPGQDERYYQAGIVAWGIDCDGSSPGLYGSVPFLRHWIDNIMLSRDLDTTYYTAL